MQSPLPIPLLLDRSEPLKFCAASESDLAPYLPRVRDPALRHALQYGVAFCHETMPAGDQHVVRLLFESGAIQVRGGSGTVGFAWEWEEGVAPHRLKGCS